MVVVKVPAGKNFRLGVSSPLVYVLTVRKISWIFIGRDSLVKIVK